MAKRIKKTNPESKRVRSKTESPARSSKSSRTKKREKEVVEATPKGKRKRSSSRKVEKEEKSTTKNRKKARARNAATGGQNTSFIIICCGVGVVLVIVALVVFLGPDKKPQKVEQPQTANLPSKPSKKEIPLAKRKLIFKDAADNEDEAMAIALKKFPSPEKKVNDIQGRELRKKRNNEKIRVKRKLDSEDAQKHGVSSRDVDKITDEGYLSGW